MTHFVVDASVAVKWYLPEAESTQATSLLAPGNTLSAPGLIYPEVANVFWKRVQRGELEPAQARLFLLDFLSSPLSIENSPVLLESAWNIATRYQRSVYDSLYLALADDLGAMLVTADRRFYNVLRETNWGGRLLWVGDLDTNARQSSQRF